MMSSLGRRGPDPRLWGSQAWSPPAAMVEADTEPASMQAFSIATLSRSLVTALPCSIKRWPWTRQARSSFSAAAMPSALQRLPSRIAAASAADLISRCGKSAPSAIRMSRPARQSSR